MSVPIALKPLRALWLGLIGLAFATALNIKAAGAGEVEDAFFRSAAGSTKTVDHAAWDKLLKAYVVADGKGLNRVDYARFKAEGRKALKDYIALLEAADPAALDKAEQFAFWANLYNAKTIDIVLEAYPVKSIKDIKLGGFLSSGPWGKKVTKVKGVELSLDDIEHVIMRGYFKDARVHYAVNCASIGCPNLMRDAFTGAKLEAQLDTGAKAYVNSPRGAQITGTRLTASKIYSWFQKDFGNSEAGVLDHLRKYADGELAGRLKGLTSIADYGYDWSLNDTNK